LAFELLPQPRVTIRREPIPAANKTRWSTS
jgi:hypothetical protein